MNAWDGKIDTLCDAILDLTNKVCVLEYELEKTKLAVENLKYWEGVHISTVRSLREKLLKKGKNKC